MNTPEWTSHSLDVLVKILFIVLTMLVGVIAYQGRVVLGSISDHEARLTRVEATLYSASDAKEDFRTHRDDMKDIITLHVEPINESLKEIKAVVEENRNARKL